MFCHFYALNSFFLLMVSIFSLTIFSCSKEEKRPEIPSEIKSIVSLSPSISRQIADLGADDKIKGVVLHDDFASSREVVGTLVNPNMEKIIKISPDVVFLSDEDSLTQKTETLSTSSIPWYSFQRNRNFESIIKNYRTLSLILKAEKKGADKISSYSAELDALKIIKKSGRRVALFLSGKPFISVSGNSYIGAIIRDSGAVNVFEKVGQPYPIISHEALLAADPEIIICMFPDPQLFFEKIGAPLARVKAVSSGRIVYLKPDNIAFYTPYDYISSVKIIRGINAQGD